MPSPEFFIGCAVILASLAFLVVQGILTIIDRLKFQYNYHKQKPLLRRRVKEKYKEQPLYPYSILSSSNLSKSNQLSYDRTKYYKSLFMYESMSIISYFKQLIKDEYQLIDDIYIRILKILIGIKVAPYIRNLDLSSKVLVSCGKDYTMFLMNDGTLCGYGLNDKWQLGFNPSDITNDDKETHPGYHNKEFTDRYNQPIGKVIYVSSGSKHTCIINEDGNLYAFGSNEKHQLGIHKCKLKRLDERRDSHLINHNQLPTLIDEDNNHDEIGQVITVSCYSKSTLVLTKRGVFGCGRNNYDQLGISEGLSTSTCIKKLTKVKLDTSTSIVSISLGLRTSLMLSEDGSVYVSGYLTNYVCNHYIPTLSTSPKKIQYDIHSIKLPRMVQACITSTELILLLSEEGKVYTCGRTEFMKAGLSPDKDSLHIIVGIEKSTPLIPMLIELDTDFNDDPLPKIKSISCSSTHCILQVNDSHILYAWGFIKDDNSRYITLVNRRKDNSPTRIQRPLNIIPLIMDQEWRLVQGKIESVTCGNATLIITTNEGTVFTMGNNLNHQIDHQEIDYKDVLSPIFRHQDVLIMENVLKS